MKASRFFAMVLAATLVMTLPAVSRAEHSAVLDSKPDFGKPDPTRFRYVLVWYNHFDQSLHAVKYTNYETPSDDMKNELFGSWCNVFDDVQNVTGKKLVAADEHFKIDYSQWTDAPFKLPKLHVRWLEIMDDESWYIVEIPK